MLARMFGRKSDLQALLQKGRRGIDMIEVLLGLALLGAIVAVVYRALGGAITGFTSDIIRNLFQW